MQGKKRFLAVIVAAAALFPLLSADVRVWAAGTYAVTISDAAVVEADFANFTVRLSERVQPGDEIRVDIALEEGTASVGTCPTGEDVDDIDISQLFFGGGEQTKVVSVETCDDIAVEGTETFDVEITAVAVESCSPEPNRCAAVVSDAKGTGTITDDDMPGELSVGNVSKPEGDAGPTLFTHTIELSGPPPGPGEQVTIECETDDGSAVSSGTEPDYNSDSGFVVFGPGQRTATFDVTVRGDTNEELDETYALTCSNAETTGEGDPPTFADATGEGEILNDDAGPTPTPTTGPRAYEVEISGDTATEGDTLNFVVSLNRPVQDGDTVTVDLSAESGTAHLDSAPCGPGIDASGPVPATMTFLGGQETMFIPIQTCEDTQVETTQEFYVRLDSASCVPDTSCSAVLAERQAIGTIEDDDASRELSVGNVEASEGDINITKFRHTVRLTGEPLEPGQSFEITCDTQSGGSQPATEDVDYESETTVLTFTDSDRSKQFVVDVFGDATPESTETYEVKCEDVDSTGTPDITQADLPVFADDTGLGTIVDDDGGPGQTPTPTPTPIGQTPSPSPTGQTPSPTPSGQTPSPTPSPTPCPTASPTPTPTATPTGSPTATPTGSPTASPTASPSPTPCPTTTPTATPTSTATTTPTSTATASPTPSTPTCTASDTTPDRSQSVTVACSGWQPSTSVTITFQSDPVLLATVTTTASGTLSASVTIPSNATTGSHSLVLVGTASNGLSRTVTIPLTVTGQVTATSTPTNATSTAVPATTVPISTSNPATLPRTGLDIGRLFTIGFILVLLGWTGIQLTRSSDSRPLWSVATERFSSALNFGGHDNRPRPSRFARVLSTLRRRRS